MATFPGTGGVDNYNGTDGADSITGLEGDDILNGNGGNDTFYISGSNFGVDTINGGTGEDEIRLYGNVSANIIDFSAAKVTSVETLALGGYSFNGTTGADSFNLSGIGVISSNTRMNMGEGNDSFIGHAGVNIVDGGSGDDTLDGRAGNDEFTGAEGNDNLIGGSGDDTFYIAGSNFGVDRFDGGDGSDEIRVNGNVAVNTIDFSAGKVTSVETLALGGYSFNGTTGNDNFNLSGIGGISSNTRMFMGEGNDVFVGHAGVNIVDGGSGYDRLDGGAGNDEFTGAEGDDTLIGGSGDDTFYIAGSSFGVDTINGGDGFDEIRVYGNVSANTIDFSNTRVFSVETLALGGYSFNGTIGNDKFNLSGIGGISSNTTMSLLDGDDTFVGHVGVNIVNGGSGNDTLDGGAGNDELYGAEGNDILIGGTGADEMTGGAGSDKYYVDDINDVVVESDGPGVDVVTTTVSFSAGTQHIENIILGGAAAINATGNALANYIVGNAAANYINGAAGADTMAGGAGNDTYIVDNAGDKVIEANVSGIDTVRSSVSFSAGAQFIENITLTGTGHINATGNALANNITGNSGNNVLDGGTGADILTGGAGSDRYYVDNVGDRVIEGNTTGTDIVSSSVSFAAGGQHIENILLTGSASINATGNALNNYLVGNSAANILSGGAGNDILTGGAGNDAFVFNTVANSSTNRDTITDFNVPSDTIWMDNAVFTALGGNGGLSAGAFHIGAGANDAADRIIYNSTTGALYYDADGSGSGAAVQFATLTKGLALTNADFLVI
ncbi:calcium-binding protein [Phyllobacterium sp. YR531]|uniref:beta strand repeat-containing protein n=1 Tax=Phyllobacterium sp. YR531 TaxID=1144343 RepID=UPI00026F9910|nr:calcium-binding protein [Phyllobacterium sp. YR531]EJM99236.1 putative calcium-binding protein [Phyllobacterium sp. YR531]